MTTTPTTKFHRKPNLYTSHVQLKVSNLERSVEFYTNVLGFNILEKINRTIYFTHDGEISLLSIIEIDNAIPSQGYTGLYHFALLLPTRKDLGNIIQHFIQLNVQIGAGDHHVSEALYINDPDGNGIEVYWDRPESDWRWDSNNQVYMTTEQVNFQSILAEADGSWNGMPAGTVMGHVHLSVSDLEKTEQFYTNVLDFEVVTRYGGQALFISTGKYHHHLGLNTWHSAGRPALPENAVGLLSYTIVLKDELYAEEVKTKLQASGAVIDNFDLAPAYGGNQLFSTIDPNGIRIIFTTDGK